MITIIVLFNLYVNAENLIVNDTEVKTEQNFKYKVVNEKLSLMWNSTGKSAYMNQIYCNWTRLEDDTAVLNYCYDLNYFNFLTFGASAMLGDKYTGKYRVFSPGKIYYNSKTCTISMDNKIIGRYFAGFCGKLYNSRLEYGFILENINLIIYPNSKEIHIDHE